MNAMAVVVAALSATLGGRNVRTRKEYTIGDFSSRPRSE
jgi:hypothetical protein